MIDKPNLKDTGIRFKRRKVYELTRDLVYHTESKDNSVSFYVMVPSGFLTDLASIDWRFWWAIHPEGKHKSAAIVHDYLYRNKYCSKWIADAVFFEIMKELDVEGWKRVMMWLTVHSGGGPYYGKIPPFCS